MTRPLIQVAEVALGRQRSPEHEWGDWMTPYLRSANVGNGFLILEDVKRMNFTPAERATFGLRDGDVLVTEGSGSRETVGTSAVWRDELPGPVCFQNTLLRIRPRLGKSNGRYLAWWARHAHAAGLMANFAGGANILHLSAEQVRRLPVPDIDIDEQRIADFLDDQVARIDNIIAARTLQMGLHDEAARNAADGQLSDDDWAASTRFGRFIRRIEQGWSPLCDAFPATNGEWGVLKVSAVRPGRFLSEENKRLPESEDPAPEYEVRPNDLLVTRANTPSLVGAFAVVPNDVRSHLILCDKIMRITLQRGLSPDFAALVGQTRRVRDALSSAGTGASQSMVNIRGADIRDLPMPVLTATEQRRRVEAQQCEVDAATVQQALLQSQVNLLGELKRSLITATVTGEFDVSTADGSRVAV